METLDRLAGEKAISLWQPWADLVVRGLKRIETRSWRTNYSGPLVIHAAKRWHPEQKELAMFDNDFRDALGVGYRPTLGAIVGTVTLGECVPTEALWGRLSLPELAFGNYSGGRWGWYLSHPIAFDDPVPYRGRQGLWTIAPEKGEAP